MQEAKAREFMNLVQYDALKFQNLKKENTINRKQSFLFINFIMFHLLQIVLRTFLFENTAKTQLLASSQTFLGNHQMFDLQPLNH